MFTGYLDAALDADAFVDGGWFRTGDLAVYDGEYLTIVDRLKDIIIRGGENISAQEVEALLVTHAGVAEAACRRRSRRGDGRAGVRVRDPARRAPSRRSTICARTSSTPASPASSCRNGSRCAPTLPRTASGKVQKAPLRCRGRSAPDAADRPARARAGSAATMDAVAKDARDEPEDDALDVIDLITDEPVPIGPADRA